MVDVVVNHMGYDDKFGYKLNVPFNDSIYYHEYCPITDYDFDHNQFRVENCWLAGLPDLK